MPVNQMISLKQRLMSLDKDIRVAVVGVGSMGKALVYQIQSTPGMRPAAIADLDIKKAIDCAKWLKLEFEIVDNTDDLNFAVQRGILAITDNGELVAGSNLIHV